MRAVNTLEFPYGIVKSEGDSRLNSFHSIYHLLNANEKSVVESIHQQLIPFGYRFLPSITTLQGSRLSSSIFDPWDIMKMKL
jgi:hypothetical protein